MKWALCEHWLKLHRMQSTFMNRTKAFSEFKITVVSLTLQVSQNLKMHARQLFIVLISGSYYLAEFRTSSGSSNSISFLKPEYDYTLTLHHVDFKQLFYFSLRLLSMLYDYFENQSSLTLFLTCMFQRWPFHLCLPSSVQNILEFFFTSIKTYSCCLNMQRADDGAVELMNDSSCLKKKIILFTLFFINFFSSTGCPP